MKVPWVNTGEIQRGERPLNSNKQWHQENDTNCWKINFHSKIAENTNTNTDGRLLKIHPNRCFSDDQSSKQRGPVSLKPEIKAIQALQKSEMGRGYLHVSSLVYVYTAITQDTFTMWKAGACDHESMVIIGPTVHTLAVPFCASKALFSLLLDKKKNVFFFPQSFHNES